MDPLGEHAVAGFGDRGDQVDRTPRRFDLDGARILGLHGAPRAQIVLGNPRPFALHHRQAIEAQFRAKAKTSWRQGAGGPTLTMLAANWPTPDAAISNDSENLETFLARQDRQKARGINGNGMGTPLAMAAKLWPSKNNWPTPQARDGDPSGRAADPSRVGDPARHGGYNLDDWAAKFADQWPTPMAVNHRSIYASENTCGKNARPLQEFVGRWMTPRVSETGQ